MHGAYLGDAGAASQPRGIHIQSIDLNADLGEHDGDGYASDDELLSVVSSASIACGAHAGNAVVMEETARRAAARGVSIGAHPSYPDRGGFGRREMVITLERLVAAVAAQIELMLECAARAGARVTYVKPHGALYNRAMRDAELAEAIVSTIASIDRGLAVLSLPDRELAVAAGARGLSVASEGFIDRAYDSSGALVPRFMPGAVLDDVEDAARRAVRLARGRPIESIDHQPLVLTVNSLCVHSDSDHAFEMVTATRRELERADFSIAAFA